MNWQLDDKQAKVHGTTICLELFEGPKQMLSSIGVLSPFFPGIRIFLGNLRTPRKRKKKRGSGFFGARTRGWRRIRNRTESTPTMESGAFDGRSGSASRSWASRSGSWTPPWAGSRRREAAGSSAWKRLERRC